MLSILLIKELLEQFYIKKIALNSLIFLKLNTQLALKNSNKFICFATNSLIVKTIFLNIFINEQSLKNAMCGLNL